MHLDEGFCFYLINLPIHTTLHIDESLGLSNSSMGSSYSVAELFPQQGVAVGTWKHGSKVTVSVGGSNARVLELKKVRSDTTPVSTAKAANKTMPGVYHAMPIAPQLPQSDNTGGIFKVNFTIPSAIKRQLEARASAYPIPWTAKDRIATWLDPTRLLGYIAIANPQDNLLADINLTIDNVPLQVKRSYNSRGLNHSRTFLGYYFDATELTVDTEHALAMTLPKLSPGAFTGIFWQNVETIYQ